MSVANRQVFPKRLEMVCDQVTDDIGWSGQGTKRTGRCWARVVSCGRETVGGM